MGILNPNWESEKEGIYKGEAVELGEFARLTYRA